MVRQFDDLKISWTAIHRANRADKRIWVINLHKSTVKCIYNDKMKYINKKKICTFHVFYYELLWPLQYKD